MKKTKICTKCKKTKPISEFHKQKKAKDGYSYWCKECMKEYNKKYNQSHKKQRQEYLEKNKEQIKKRSQKYGKIYYQNHKQEIKNYNKIQKKKYYQEHKEEIKKKVKKYREENKDKIDKKHKQWQQSHKTQRNNRQRERRKNDINFRIICNLRTRLNDALKYNSKSKSAVKLIGCSIKKLKQHLQKQFKKGMNWKNWGTGYHGRGRIEWHIDHIIPIASFDLSKPKEQLKCFHYTNLQPLWAEENIKKGAK